MALAETAPSGATRPFFTVVIPTYNREILLVKTLQSVLRQTWPHYEVIVVDNCSTDNTEEVMAGWCAKDERIRYIRHEQNFERSVSRNTGMKNARGDFLTFLDSDDLALPDNLERAAAYVHKYPDSRFFHNRYVLVDASGRILYRYKSPDLHSEKRLWHLSHGNYLSCIGTFIGKEIYEKYRFDTRPELLATEDWDFWLRVIADYPCGEIPVVTNQILQHDGRTVKSVDVDQIMAKKQVVIDKVRSDDHLSRIYGPYLKRMMASACTHAGITANSFGDFRAARRMLHKALREDPGIGLTLRFLRAWLTAVLHGLRPGP